MDCTNTDVFSPIRNVDDKKIDRQSDDFSEFLKGPDIYKKKYVNSESLENVDENTAVNNISSIKAKKTHQKKASKYEIFKSAEGLASSTSTSDTACTIASEKSCSLKKEVSKNEYPISKSNDKLRANQQSEAEFSNKKKYDSHLSKKNSVNSVKSSLQVGTAAASIASVSKEMKKANEPSLSSGFKEMKKANEPFSSGSKEMKKVNEPSSSSGSNVKKVNESSSSSGTKAKKINEPSSPSGSKEVKKANEPCSTSQRNPLAQMKSGVLERMINDAVGSHVDDIRQLMWSHQLNLLKAFYKLQDEMDQRRAENITMFKIIEELLEENRLLRTALLAHR